LLAGGVDRDRNIVSALVETVTRLVVQELLKANNKTSLAAVAAMTAATASRSGRVTVMSGAGCHRGGVR
jgi:hypothetical protein